MITHLHFMISLAHVDCRRIDLLVTLLVPASHGWHLLHPAGTWDLHCNYEGSGVGIGQDPDLIACSEHGNYFDGQYWCAQYPNNCSDVIVRTYEIPLQRQYLKDLSGSGHGGFMHSCFLGAYWNSGKFNNTVLRKDTMWWHQIAVENTTMYEAVARWWGDADATGARPRRSDTATALAATSPPEPAPPVAAAASAAAAAKRLYLDCVWQTAPCAAGMLPGQCATEPVWPGPGTAPRGYSPDLPWYTSKYFCNPT